ncbi:MAG: CHRD domain-containing protein [Gemmatimonadales bacterium]
MTHVGRAAVAAAVFVATACGGGSSLGGLDAEQSYNIALTSAAEVPTPKTTTASGSAQIVVFPESIDFQLSATSMTGITMAHIHNGAPGVAGPVVVTLFLPGAPTAAVNGIFASGTLTAANLPAGVTLESLKTLLLSGNAYVNVHTTANPTGELRGQIK